MNPYVSLIQVQSNKLSISPQLMQSVHILQLSSMELSDYIQEQSVGNPLLDIIWHSPGGYTKKIRSSTRSFSKPYQEEWLNHIGCPVETLESILIHQLELVEISKKHKKIARFMAGNLNDDGYLIIDMSEIRHRFQISMEDMNAALQCLQSLDPPGVGARDLKECLQLQINRDEDAAPFAYRIVSDYLPDLGAGRYRRIAKQLKISIEEVYRASAYIRSLNPRPGLSYSPLSDKYLIPDASIQKHPDGFIIIMNETGVPKVSINPYYLQLCTEYEHHEAKAFLRSHLQSANVLIRGLDERQKTLHRVIQAITKEQLAFFEHGISHLKPMKLKVIADILQFHESTVSRAVQNKYVQTPHGLFELNFFFTTGLSTEEGIATSSENIKAKIKALIQNEDKQKPLSDREIVDALAKDKIQISRRTVMKYREELQYLSSRFRRSG